MTAKRKKTVSASRVKTHELVMPNDTNPLGNLIGGKLMHWMDLTAAISAQRHCNRNVVTAAVDSVEFVSPAKLGEVVAIEGEVSRAFHTSMEIVLYSWAENLRTGSKRLCTTSFYTFVAVDADGKPVPVPEIIPETDEQIKRYEDAEKRRNLRLEHSREIRKKAELFNKHKDTLL